MFQNKDWFFCLALTMVVFPGTSCTESDDTITRDDNNSGSGDADSDSDTDSDTDADTDTDNDADSDSDSDTDGDSDSDSDSDSDGDTPPGGCIEECKVNSGYPCPCDKSTCDDGSSCQEVSKFTYGICSKKCGDDNACNINLDCGATSSCDMKTSSGDYCAYECSGDSDCPSNMECSEFGNKDICVPFVPKGNKKCAECEINSGFPCPCTADHATCDDGSMCVITGQNDPVGICLRECNYHSDCFVDYDCNGFASCALGIDGQDYCAMTCMDSSECPNDSYCNGQLVPEVPFCSGFDSDPCPMNSGYPCACNKPNGECDDGSDCTTADGLNLFCSPKCGGDIDNPVCQNTEFGLNQGSIKGGACALDFKENVSGNCAIVCKLKSPSEGIDLEGNCPPGLTCETNTMSGVTQGYCQ